MTDNEPPGTQRDLDSTVISELELEGFRNALEIGRGGFGIVYKCVQSSLDRTVAVKVLAASVDSDDAARFLREQHAMGRLTGHPNIVIPLHVGTTPSNRPYIVMQYHAMGSLEDSIRTSGPLSTEDSLRLGVKLAGALESSHRLGILHRDVKPGNVLFTGYGEPALTDFGIARISGGFETSTGALIVSPAFAAPEVLRGETAGASADIYGLAATIFCAISGHAAFQRRSGEDIMAQFLRIAAEPIPDLRNHGGPADLSDAIGRAMSTDPRDRQSSAAEFGEELRRIQADNRFTVDEMALIADDRNDESKRNFRRPDNPVAGNPPNLALPSLTRLPGESLPLELTRFIGRRRELIEAKEKISASRLVTLAGIGGVGKTRLAIKAASDICERFGGGVSLIELGELQDDALIVDLVAAGIGVREQPGHRLEESLAYYLHSREVLLVLDNCEHVLHAVANLVAILLRSCPQLRILATSREPLGIRGEAVIRVPPLTLPSQGTEPTLRGLPRYDAVTLFVERAATAVPGFGLAEENRVSVMEICRRLDGIPLLIELAASRLRSMSIEQILDRLADRINLLTRGSRTAPTRQQTLQLCMDWSYELCTPDEQQLWERLSVFSGGCQLDSIEGICASDGQVVDVLDGVSALIDKSILARVESGQVVRFQMLETVHDYGRTRSEKSGGRLMLQRRHLAWYRNMVEEAESEWISGSQVEWISRLEREQSNLRAAMDFGVSNPEESDSGMRVAAALLQFWLTRGLLNEGRYWLDRVLEGSAESSNRIKALWANSILAEEQGDLDRASTLVQEAKILGERSNDRTIQAQIAHAEGHLALFKGNLNDARRSLERTLEILGSDRNMTLKVWTLTILGIVYEFSGDTSRSISCHELVLEITQAQGESAYRAYSLWAMSVAVWRQGDSERAARMLKQSLRLTKIIDDPQAAASCLETFAWIAGGKGQARRAAVLMSAADSLVQPINTSVINFPNLIVYRRECEQQTRRSLGERAFQAARRQGRAMCFDEAVAYALVENSKISASPTGRSGRGLTKRETEVAQLIAQGFTNKSIAARLVISVRTAQGHVEHVLTKLGFTSRAQVAAWVVEQSQSQESLDVQD